MLIRAIASITISWYFCGFVLVLRTDFIFTFGCCLLPYLICSRVFNRIVIFFRKCFYLKGVLCVVNLVYG